MNNVLSAVGRVCLAMVFILSAITKIGNFSGTVAYMQAHGIPAAPFFLYGAVTLEFIGGVLVALGYKSRIGIYMLLAFLLPTTAIFHGKLGDRAEMVHFLKNLSIAGGLIFMLGNGSGKWALSKD